MASDATHFPRQEGFTKWIPDFLRKELAPYPGRGALVARIVISATVTMILIVTFRIPGGVPGTLTAFLLSRETLISTARSAIATILAFLIGALFIPVGARLFASTPEMHFLWTAGSIFIVFFLLRCLIDYGIALAFALVVSSIVGIWYLPGPAERNVELTLWVVAATVIGAVVTLSVETIFYAIRGKDVLVEGLDARLALIEELVAAYGDGRAVSTRVQASLAQFALVGTGTLRRHLARTSYPQPYRTRMSTLVSLVARSVEYAAALVSAHAYLGKELRVRATRLRRSLADIRQCLRTRGEPCEGPLELGSSDSTPLLSEIESMVSLMPSLFTAENAIDPELTSIEDPTGSFSLFTPDAFSNPEHLRYILGGTTAAMLCYVLYVSLDWPGLSSSVTTCILTGLITVGASRQKQVLRLAGSILGGVVAGLGSQLLVLPYIDSIGGFTILFVLMTAFAAWIGTSSSRLSYFGIQFAFAFYLIHLGGFSIQTNLAIGRDRVLGVLLGSTMMWLVFERIFPRSAADEMVRLFALNLRNLADLLSLTARPGDHISALIIRRQREQIYRRFGEVTAQSDAVPFETGPLRASRMAARDRVRRWQTVLRSFFLLEAPLLQFRIFGSVSTTSNHFIRFQEYFRSECSMVFLKLAATLEDQLATHKHNVNEEESLLGRIDSSMAGIEEELSERERALLGITRTIATLVDRLQIEIASESLYDIPPTYALRSN